MKKQITSLCLAALMLLSGCAAQTQPEGSQTELSQITQSQTELTIKIPETPEEFHQAMIDRSLYSLGNTSRMKAKIEQAKSGEKTTVAYIGGSITNGYIVGDDNCYARLSYEYFADTYGTGDNVEYVKSGISGTPSNLGILRLDRDILSKNPDIVFIEFAVNDSQDKIAKESYESMVKTILSQDNEPAVVLLLNVLESGYSAQPHMKEIGEYYGVQIISAADALTAEFDEGRMVWDDYSNDGSHPNIYGNQLLCEFISNMYTAVENSPKGEDYKMPLGFVYGAPYENTQMITPENTESDLIAIESTGSFEATEEGCDGFPTSWKYNGGNERLKLKVNASSFFVIFKRNKTDDMGSFDVYLNGDKLKTVRTSQADGWGEAFSEQIIKFQTPREMEIEICPTNDNGDKTIEILGIAACANETTAY